MRRLLDGREVSVADQFDAETRSRIMRSVTSADTFPERWTAEALYEVGADYEAQVSDLPGTPDFAMRDRKVAVFVHGCFWHRHDCPDGRQMPETNRQFWREKFDRNVARDAEAVEALEDAGWDVVVVWECEIHEDPEGTRERLVDEALDGDRPIEWLAEAALEASG